MSQTQEAKIAVEDAGASQLNVGPVPNSSDRLELARFDAVLDSTGLPEIEIDAALSRLARHCRDGGRKEQFAAALCGFAESIRGDHFFTPGNYSQAVRVIERHRETLRVLATSIGDGEFAERVLVWVDSDSNFPTVAQMPFCFEPEEDVESPECRCGPECDSYEVKFQKGADLAWRDWAWHHGDLGLPKELRPRFAELGIVTLGDAYDYKNGPVTDLSPPDPQVVCILDGYFSAFFLANPCFGPVCMESVAVEFTDEEAARDAEAGEDAALQSLKESLAGREK